MMHLTVDQEPCTKAPANPAASVRGPTHVVRTGKTPVLQPTEARQLLDTIDTSTLSGLRDRRCWP